MQEPALEIFEEQRSLLFAIAYRMLGSAMDAEDALQEAFLRWQKTDLATVQSPKAFLTTVITRLCINQLQSARVKREEYIGTWLPEPIITGFDPESKAEMADSLSMAFLVLLESLTPLERAVFLLREVFGYDYAEIAHILAKEEANCRQIFHRARQHITAHRPRFAVSDRQKERILSEFIRASQDGDIQGLLSILAQDVVLWADGGGKVVAALKPVYGSYRVARFICGALKKLAPPNRVGKVATLNGQDGFVNYVEGQVQSVIITDIRAETIINVYIVSNPEKLQGLPSLHNL
jgi:RNA polymerase sigma-70 factor, ECF subfamily